MLVTGLTVAGVLAVAVAEHDAGALDRVLVATLALLALSAFDAVPPKSSAARGFDTTPRGGQAGAGAHRRRSGDSRPGLSLHPPRHALIELHQVTARYDRGEQPVLEGVDLRLEPGARGSRRPQRVGKDHGHQPALALPRPRVGSGDDRRPGHP